MTSTMKLLAVVMTMRLILSNCETIYRSLRGYQNNMFSNLKILENPIAARSARSLLDCTKLCLETESCLSFAYNSVTRSCLLWDSDFVDISTTKVVSENGWMYYYAVKECTIPENLCLAQSGFTYEPDTCFCFKYLSRKYFYIDAVIACAAMNAELAKNERGLKQLKMEQFLEKVVDGDVRIQGSRNSLSDTWKYKNGSKMKYFNWNTAFGQPSNGYDELRMVIKKSKGYGWHDVITTATYAVICQLPSG